MRITYPKTIVPRVVFLLSLLPLSQLACTQNEKNTHSSQLEETKKTPLHSNGYVARELSETELAGRDPLDLSKQFYDSRKPYDRPVVDYQNIPAGLPNISAETCGACHSEIYQEWKLSAHAQAYKGDPQFIAELKKSRSEHPFPNNGDMGWMCMNCHTPLVNQLDKLVVGLEGGDRAKPIYAKNPKFDAKLADEAITCATCHVRDGKIITVHDTPAAPHAVRKDPEFLQSSQLCNRCHQVEAFFKEKNFGCFFSTGREVEASHQNVTCQSCHMPSIDRRVVPHDSRLPIRKTRHHWFGGSMIAKRPDLRSQINQLVKYFPDALDIDLYAKGSQLTLKVTNVGAAHKVPTGDPERRIEFNLIVYRPNSDSVPFLQGNQEIGSIYEWWPTVREVSSNRLAAGESLTTSEYLSIPPDLFSFLPRKPKICSTLYDNQESALLARKAEKSNIINGMVSKVELIGWKKRLSQEAIKYNRIQGKTVPGRLFYKRIYWLLWGPCT